MFGLPKLNFGRILVGLGTWFGKELFLVLVWFRNDFFVINLGRLYSLVEFFGVPLGAPCGDLVTFRSLVDFLVPLGVPPWGDVGRIFHPLVGLWVFGGTLGSSVKLLSLCNL